MSKFKARARAIDMLGRQQIAGIQNAVSELFKNAYDAYATVARIDYFEAQRLIVVRDNGVGMTKEDFEGKWLVLGTESKFGSGEDSVLVPPGIPRRPISGEKGIGRLAIALLGRQVLVLSRARRQPGVDDLVVGLVHWGLFELPSLNLEEIEIPVKVFPGGTLPTKDEIGELTSSLLANIEKLEKDHKTVSFESIKYEVESFQPDPVNLEGYVQPHDDGSLSLLKDGTGTHFLIGPATGILNLEISAEERLKDYSFRKGLMGFYNSVFLATPPPPISTSFRYWPAGSLAGTEMLDPELFFSPEELANSDILLSGSVDAFGQFTGDLRVYETRYDGIAIPWKEAKGASTECGEFKVVFGYIMGIKSESTLPPDDFSAIDDKLDRLGGMYVYRDGIRVLPYGDHSFDWLEVEKRRNKGAGHYFFSFRRMFGAVILTRAQNAKLIEKAGREGWQQNRAYRQLREILINLLLNLAADYFRKGGTYTDVFEVEQAEIRHKARLLEKRQKQVATKKRSFVASLDSFFEASNSGLIKGSISALRLETQGL